MKKSHGFLPKILLGKKTIESRWYTSKRAPWEMIKPGETVYFKDSGSPVTVKAKVRKVLQFADLNPREISEIVAKHGQEIGISANEAALFCQARRDKKYCILIFLDNVGRIEPFEIDKTGFGNMTAWISVPDINMIKH
ncbi:MAG: hypothetical protein WCT32_04915 [Patescibacteria group bacterium]|jgi:ASC-1-like (ASCH) protein